MANNEIKIHISAENQEFITKMHDVVESIKGAKRESDSAGGSTKGFTSKLAEMGAIATGAYSTLMMLAGSIKAVVMPIMKYSSALEQNTIAFETFLGNAQLAKQYLGDLQKIAADTPFDLPGVTDAAKKLLAFGFSAKQSLQMLRTIGDASSGLGMGTEGINRITLAIGQIKAKGKVMGDELLQLTEAGIPAYTILADKLGLNAKQIQNIGDAGIDADTAINALLEGMNDKFGGLSSKIADTKQGMLSTIKDNAMAIGTFILSPLDDSLKDGLRKVRDWTNDIADAIREGDGKTAVSSIFDNLIPPYLLPEIQAITAGLKDLKDSFNGIVSGGSGLGGEIIGGVVEGLADCLVDAIAILNVIGDIGNTLLWVVNQILPEGSVQFRSIRELVAFIVKTIIEFFILRKVLSILKAISGVITTVSKSFSEAVNWVRNLTANIKGAYNGVVNFGREIVKAFKDGKSFGEIFKTVLSRIWSQLKRLVSHPWEIALLFSASTTAKQAVTPENVGIDITDQMANASDLEWQKENDSDRQEYPDPPPSNTLDDSNDSSKYYQAQKKAMDQATEQIKQYYDSLISRLEDDLKKLNDSYDENGNIVEQTQKIQQLQYNIAEAKIAQAQEIKNAIVNTDFEDDTEKSLKIGAVDNELEKLQRDLSDAGKALSEVADITTKAGQSISNFGDVAVQGAENRLGIAYGDKNSEPGKLVCTQLVIESWKDAGLAFADVASEWVPDLIEQAKSSGLWRDANSGYNPKAGDAIVVNGDNHVGLADGNGGIYHASSSRQRVVHDNDVNSTFADDITGYIAVADTMKSKVAVKGKSLVSNMKKYQQDFNKIIDDGNKVMEELAASVGDVSTAQISKTKIDYDAKIKKFNENGLTSFAKAAETLKEFKIGKLDFKQNEKNIESAYEKASREQKEILKSIYNYPAAALEATNKAAENYIASVKSEKEKLEGWLKTAQDNGWTDFANNIKDQLDKITDNIKSIYKINLEKLDEELRQKLALIESNSNLTTMQKKNLSDDARRDYLQNAIKNKREERSSITDDKKIKQINFEIQELENQLDGLGTTLDKVHQSSKQAFEDGLLDFLSRGINECKSLGDAFRNMANSILQSIQRVYAEALTKNIMSALGLGAIGGNLPSSRPSINNKPVQGPLRPDGSFADGGSIVEDKIQGPGTGVSDSILAWVDNAKKFIRVSDGEWIMKEKAVNYYGPTIMNAINRGMIPKKILDVHSNFANGGSIRGSMPSTGVAGAYGLSADIANDINPNIYTNVSIDGGKLAGAVQGMINARVDTRVEKNMINNSARYDKLLALTRRK